MATSARFFLLTAVVAIGIVVLWPVAGLSAPAPALLSQHSQPATRLPAKMVAIVDGGKTFHDPKCTMMHGHPHMISAEAAARLGYSPCIRCMREALAKR
jgi:hypothetical protein